MLFFLNNKKLNNPQQIANMHSFVKGGVKIR
jgi:hypothetical protein